MAPVAFDVHATIGAVEVGVLISAVLFGVTTVQTYIYYSRYPDDALWKKLMVACVWLAELGHMILVSHTLYTITISDYGAPKVLTRPPPSLSVAIIFAGVISSLVQAYFAQRILLVSNSWIIPVTCWVMTALRFIAYLVASIEGLKMESLSRYTRQWGWLLKTILALGASLDLLIAATLVYHLKHQRSRAYYGTIAIIDKLILWTIQTGLLTSVTGIVMLICFLKMKHNFVWLAFFVFLARIFANSLLAALNGREALRAMRPDIIEFRTRSSSSKYPSATFARPARERTHSRGISVEMTKVTEISVDTTGGTSKDQSQGSMYL